MWYIYSVQSCSKDSGVFWQLNRPEDFFCQNLHHDDRHIPDSIAGIFPDQDVLDLSTAGRDVFVFAKKGEYGISTVVSKAISNH